MASVQALYADLLFRLSSLTWLGMLDMLLVAVAFYLLLNLVRHSRAAFLLRGILALVVILFVVTILLPLPTFDWLVRGMLIAMLAATPVIFQPELRRFLERVERNIGLARSVRQTAAEDSLPRLMRAVENLSARCTGALIVLEGNTPIQKVLDTGVYIGGKATSELLQAIFHPETPLHDGAVILREDRLIAAGCVLPLTERPLNGDRRLGTRHRAAVGLSESGDALVIVVSEETGEVSAARYGRLWRPLDSAALRQQLATFYTPSTPDQPAVSLRSLAGRFGRQFLRRHSLPGLNRLFAQVALLLVALLLALAAWSFVGEQTNPTKRIRVDAIPLRLENIPAGAALLNPPPASVSALIQTTASVQDTLRQSSFQAVVSLTDLAPGLYHLPIQINSGAGQVRVLSVDPPRLDVELAPVISRTLAVSIDLPEQQHLSPAYTIASAPVALPNQVQVTGPAPLVERVSRVQTTISLANGHTSVWELRPLKALDEAGQEVGGVNLQPAQVQVNVSIRQKVNARDVGIRAITDGAPAPGYWLSGLSATPASITLQGSPDRLAEIESFVDTLPVDVSQAAGDLSVHIPLDLPPDIQALDGEGNPVNNVIVTAHITARKGDLIISRPVELLGAKSAITASIDPPEVELLLSGPLPTLNQIESNPDLVRVLVETTGLASGPGAELAPTIIVPNGVQAQIVPRSVLITLP